MEKFSEFSLSKHCSEYEGNTDETEEEETEDENGGGAEAEEQLKIGMDYYHVTDALAPQVS